MHQQPLSVQKFAVQSAHRTSLLTCSIHNYTSVNIAMKFTLFHLSTANKFLKNLLAAVDKGPQVDTSCQSWNNNSKWLMILLLESMHYSCELLPNYVHIFFCFAVHGYLFGHPCGHWMVFGSVDVCNFFIDVLYTHALLESHYSTFALVGKPMKFNDILHCYGHTLESN